MSDAPELKQAFGSKSKQNLSDLVYRKQVTVDWTKRDRYGRIIGKVLFIPETCISPACLEKTDANCQQVAAGMAWHYKQYERERSPAIRGRGKPSARREARTIADTVPVAPWEWRRGNKGLRAKPLPPI